MINMSKTIAAAAAFAAAAGLAAPASADEVAEFYRGKTVSVVIPFAAGGLYSTFGQLLARHLGDHIPGEPNVIAQHMPGAGGNVGLNHLYAAAPKDGTVVATPAGGVVTTPLLRPGSVRYDPAKLNYLGAWNEIVLTMTVFHTAPVKTLEEGLETEAIFGSTGTTTFNYWLPTLTNNMLGTKFRVITGYGGGNEVRLAMERGEAHGFAGGFLGWTSTRPDWLRDGKLIHLVQFGNRRSPQLPDVPVLMEYAKTDTQRAVFGFLADAGLTGFTLVAPPEVPEARLAALEKAYGETLADPAFLAAAEKLNFPIAPLSRQEVEEAVKRLTGASPETIATTRKAMGFED